MKRRVLLNLLITTLLLAPFPALATFKCPVADAQATGGKPTLSAGDMAGTGVRDTLTSAIHGMRAEGAKSGEIVDRLVVADCSRIDAESNVSDPARRSRFAVSRRKS